MDQIEKFIRRLDKNLALKLMLVLQDVSNLKLANYDYKKMKGFQDLFRIRIGKIRIIFKKTKTHGQTVYIEFRGKVYKKF